MSPHGSIRLRSPRAARFLPKQSSVVPYTPSTLAYSLSSPGSIKQACPRMRIALLPTSQKNVETGEAIHNKGSPASQLDCMDGK